MGLAGACFSWLAVFTLAAPPARLGSEDVTRPSFLVDLPAIARRLHLECLGDGGLVTVAPDHPRDDCVLHSARAREGDPDALGEARTPT